MSQTLDRRLLMYLMTAVKYKASDLHLQPDTEPYLRVDNKMVPIGQTVISGKEIGELANSSMPASIWSELQDKFEVDYALTVPDLGRFRINVYTTRGEYGMVARVVHARPQTVKELQLPLILTQLMDFNEGLILVGGSTGSGKSTTLAAMIDHVNSSIAKRVITIEDPIEILHPKKRSIISQREVGMDTNSFDVALRSALRQNPDIIMVGEIRDMATAIAALQAAQTGHLVLATIHASNAEECVTRFINLFPEGQRDNTRGVIASVLKAALIQKLIPNLAGGKSPALEILLNTERVRSYISDGSQSEDLNQIMQEGQVHGMRTLDQDLANLITNKTIDRETGVSAASNRQWIEMKLRQLNI